MWCIQNETSDKKIVVLPQINKKTNKLRGLSSRANIPTDDRSLSAKLVPTFANIGCQVDSVTDPFSRILGFLDRFLTSSFIIINFILFLCFFLGCILLRCLYVYFPSILRSQLIIFISLFYSVCLLHDSSIETHHLYIL
jgi:hypothetical protein